MQWRRSVHTTFAALITRVATFKRPDLAQHMLECFQALPTKLLLLEPNEIKVPWCLEFDMGRSRNLTDEVFRNGADFRR
jgi:hypothetical protein